MPKSRDYYEVLGVARGSTSDQIRKAYRKLARQLHPDVNKATDASKRFSEVQEAYDVLSDDDKRKAYDQFGHAGSAAGAATSGWGKYGSATGPRSGHTTWTNVDLGDMEGGEFASIFEQMFGGGGGGRAGGPFAGGGRSSAANSRSQSARGQDVERAVTVSFMTAAMGGTENLRLGSDSSTISIKIPSGIESGAKLRVKGKGLPSPNGGPQGDLILTIDVGRHPYFRREGLDVLIDVPISITEAVLGVTITAPLITAGGIGSVEIKVPPGASSGRKLRIKGRGIKDPSGRVGDFYAIIQIAAQAADELSENGRRIVQELNKELKNPRESAPYADDLKT